MVLANFKAFRKYFSAKTYFFSFSAITPCMLALNMNLSVRVRLYFFEMISTENNSKKLCQEWV